jgi:hypothetical protein
MAEAVLVDVDRFIMDRGLPHTRYVDDFRIFADSESTLRAILRDLTTYLYEVHRLNLSGDKTKILTSEKFATEILQNQYELEKIDIFEHIAEVANPYTNELEESYTEEGREQAVKELTELLNRVLGFAHLDLGLARAIVRKAKGLEVPELIPLLLENGPRFMPVVNDVFLYLAEVINPWTPRAVLSPLEELVQKECAAEPAFRIWAEWLITSAPHFVQCKPLRQFVERRGSFYARARLAVIHRNIAWVREHRLKYFELAQTDRLAVILASPILARDEREPFFRRILQPASGATTLERWYARTALNGAIDHSFTEDEIPF